MKMIKMLEETGFAVEREYPGIYYVKGRALFDTQIVVIRELSGAEHSGLKILGLDAREEDIVRFLEKAGDNRNPRYAETDRVRWAGCNGVAG